ncbi:STAS domain-containing protein [Streptomyces sp. NPDC001530]|uniref:STAS domain-containing protein n=1 Tax=Streptomyces sp. NPDC001530 TaxID=3364582 RepID=UPI0036BEAEFC
MDIDFQNVTFCDVSSLTALLWARRQAAGAGAALRVVRVRPHTALLFRHTRGDRLLDVSGT